MAEPISIAEAKLHLRGAPATDDTLITGYITTAREWVENETGMILVKREITETIGRLCDRSAVTAWPVDPDQPLTITYIDSFGDEQTIADAVLRGASRPARLLPAAGARWPLRSSIRGKADVTFTAGFATAADVPAVAKQAMLVLIAAYYENRTGEDLERAEASAARLCRGLRRRAL